MLTPVNLRRATSTDSGSTRHRGALDPTLGLTKARHHHQALFGIQAHSSSHIAVLRVRPGGNNLHPSNKSPIVTKSSEPQRVTPHGIAIGTLSSAAFHCNNDPMVSPEHGTLECTAKHGVWVYVDHSVYGTTLNNSRRVHREAVVVRTGDRLLVGNTEVELHFDCLTDSSRKSDARQPTLSSRQYSSSNQTSAMAPSPIDWSERPSSSTTTSPASADRRPEPFKMARPHIATSGAVFATAAPPEYIASPVPAAHARRKRHSMTAFTPTPSPPSTSPFAQQPQPRMRPILVPSAPSTPPRQDATRPCSAVTKSPHEPLARRTGNQLEGHSGADESGDSSDCEPTVRRAVPSQRSSRRGSTVVTSTGVPPPPLGYSSSPVTGPAVAPRTHAPPPLAPQRQQSGSGGDAPKSQRDNLRVQLLLKNLDGYQLPPSAASGDTRRVSNSNNSNSSPGTGPARPVPSGLEIPGLAQTSKTSVSKMSIMSPTARTAKSNNQLDFTPPSSPVAHKDILRQKESLLTILKHKYKEEQLLKQQQEEWMRHNFSLAAAPATPATPLLSPRSKPSDAASTSDATDSDDMSDLVIPPRAPVLLRTISLGIRHASPRLTAAVLASRARAGSSDSTKRSNQQRSSPGAKQRMSRDSIDCVSVSSSVSTELACHRRVTRSLSIASSDDLHASSADGSDFAGYDDDDDNDTSARDDRLAAFTAHGLYASSDECASTPNDCSARRRGSQLFSTYYCTAPSSSASSSLYTSSGTTSASGATDRFSLDMGAFAREPEDDDDDDVGERPSPSGASPPLALFDAQRRSPFKPTARFASRRSSTNDASALIHATEQLAAAVGSDRMTAASPTGAAAARRYRRPSAAPV